MYFISKWDYFWFPVLSTYVYFFKLTQLTMSTGTPKNPQKQVMI